jgi:transcriptional regulator with XRE-family HTH domain
VPLWFNFGMNTLAETLPGTLQQVRKARRLSQLELSMRVGVSQRHVSFVESGRAKPSRSLLVAWLEELDAPMPLRNATMLQAGYAPVYSAASLDDPALAHARDALAQLLNAHDPMPAFVLDADWNVHHMNRGARWFATTLMPNLATLPTATSINMLDLLIHPDGATKSITNLREVGPLLLSHLRHDANAHPALAAKVEAFAARLPERLGEKNLQPTPSHPVAPVLCTRFATVHGELAFFSMFTTFGTPQNITLASLRVEHMFAADETTRAILAEMVI